MNFTSTVTHFRCLWWFGLWRSRGLAGLDDIGLIIVHIDIRKLKCYRGGVFIEFRARQDDEASATCVGSGALRVPHTGERIQVERMQVTSEFPSITLPAPLIPSL